LAWVEVVRRRLTEWRPITLTEAENFRIRPTNDVLAVRGSLKVSFGETSAWLDTTAI